MTPLLLSALVAPGAGQFYRREFLKGFLILGLCLLGFAWLFVDLVSIVNASLQVEPLLESGDLMERAIEIRQSFSLAGLKFPLSFIVVAYLWGVIDSLWSAHKEKRALQGTQPDKMPPASE
ncbi:MAG: hypothetical protein ABIH23_22205 [bacterium]